MPLYELKINYERVNREKTGFRFKIKGDLNKKWGCQVNTIQTASPESTMRVARLTLERDRFEFVTKLHCTVARIIFSMHSTPNSADAYPDYENTEVLDIRSVFKDRPVPINRWWELYEHEDEDGKGQKTLIAAEEDEGLLLH